MSSDLPHGWQWQPLETLCSRVSVGHVGETSQFFSDRTGVTFLRSQNVRPGQVDLADVKFITPEFHRQSKKSQLSAGDLMIVRVGQNRGDCAVLPEGLGEVNCANIVFARPDHRYSDFLGFFFNSPVGRSALLAVSSGSAQLVLNTKAIAKVLVPVPPPEDAVRIGALLKTFSDRITLLRETNATLEAIAQALFKSWFVDFDPVHTRARGEEPAGLSPEVAALFPDSFEESELGMVPKGWRFQPLAEAYEINPTRKLKKGESAPYLDMASVATSGHTVTGVTEREMGSGTKFINGDTLLARITPCLENGKTAFVDFLDDEQTGWGSTEFIVLRPNVPLPLYHGYLLARHPAFREHAIQSMSGTSGRQRVQNDVLGLYRLVVPTPDVANAFGDVVNEVQASIAANHQQAQTLATLRDTLLPRLISGQLRLPEAEVTLQEAGI